MVVADLVEKQISDWSYLHSPPRLLTRIQLPCTFPCRSAASELLCLGDERKHIGQTLHNDRSSRSHTAFRLSLEQGGVAGELNIVDLAGSERLSPHMRAGGASVQAARASEGAHINKSLLVLSTVIHKLSEPGRAQHIPYRSSKITRILQARLSLSTAPLLPSPTIPPPTFSCPTSKFLPYSSHLCSSQLPPLLLPPPIAHEPSSQLSSHTRRTSLGATCSELARRQRLLNSHLLCQSCGGARRGDAPLASLRHSGEAREDPPRHPAGTSPSRFDQEVRGRDKGAQATGSRLPAGAWRGRSPTLFPQRGSDAPPPPLQASVVKACNLHTISPALSMSSLSPTDAVCFPLSPPSPPPTVAKALVLRAAERD